MRISVNSGQLEYCNEDFSLKTSAGMLEGAAGLFSRAFPYTRNSAFASYQFRLHLNIVIKIDSFFLF